MARNSWTNSDGLKIYYGPVDVEETVPGEVEVDGFEREVVLTFAGDTYSSVSFTIPAGASILADSVVCTVHEVFALGGTTPTLNIGTSGTHGTNYLGEISEAQAEALGTYKLSQGGTFASGAILAADTTVVIGTDGTTPTVGAGGRATVRFKYIIKHS